jgi:proteasome lid subunit RPN8/RPN11
MSQTTAAPDVRELKEKDLPRAQFPGRGGEDFRIFLQPDVHKEIRKHGAEDKSVEICGVLVGQWQQDDDGPFLVILASIRGEAAANKFAEVTFTHETWATINKRMDAEFTDRFIVGWYHTHPDFGIFLSDRDRFIHEHFFSTAGQVAYVVDPVRKEEGFFIWSGGKPILCDHYWIGTGLQMAPTSEESAAKSPHQAKGGGESQQRPTSSGPPPRDYTWAVQLLTGLCIFLIGYMLASRSAEVDRQRLQQGVVAYYGINKVLKPGLSEQLAQAHAGLSEVSAMTRRLAAEQLKPSTRPAAEFVSAWEEVLARTAACQRLLERVREVYGLTPDEEAVLQNAIIQATAVAGGELLPATPSTRSTTRPVIPSTQAATGVAK